MKHRERSKIAQLPQNIRVEQVIRDVIDQYAKTLNTSVSGAVRELLIDALLDKGLIFAEAEEIKPAKIELKYTAVETQLTLPSGNIIVGQPKTVK